MSIVTYKVVEEAVSDAWCRYWSDCNDANVAGSNKGAFEAIVEAIAPMLMKHGTQDVPDGMCLVTKEDGDNYCRILRVLGMEEEGDPVAEVEMLAASAAKATAMATEREMFEEWVTASPFERGIARYPDSHDPSWPGHYRSYEVEMAWEAWQARAKAVFVPDEMPMAICAPISLEWMARKSGYRDGWNACRDAMLKSMEDKP